jgi:hypothetical protein
MVKIEYVYEKPVETKKSYKKLFIVLVLVIAIAIIAGFLYTNNFWNSVGHKNNTDNQTFTNDQNNTEYNNPENQYYEDLNITIPPEYKGVEGLDYVRRNYAPIMEKAKSLCTDKFKGEWRDTSTEMGCYDMHGFLTLYCGAEAIQSLMNLCNSINGISTCSTNQVSCSVQGTE